ncbi:MAG TPA: hypothetical protein VG096_00440 [Bryobacteraceae bacterium]|jgi:hypothetical protein|nr:hypothetical protein [Bryobacteraceae bacterium]
MDAKIGLCETCRNVQVIRSERGSIFYLCRLHFTDDRFPKYPRLPVVECSGYRPRDQEPPENANLSPTVL